MKQIIEIAQKINKANKTLATQTELIKLNGGFDNPMSLAINAAKFVISGYKLSFNF